MNELLLMIRKHNQMFIDLGDLFLPRKYGKRFLKKISHLSKKIQDYINNNVFLINDLLEQEISDFKLRNSVFRELGSDSLNLRLLIKRLELFDHRLSLIKDNYLMAKLQLSSNDYKGLLVKSKKSLQSILDLYNKLFNDSIMIIPELGREIILKSVSLNETINDYNELFDKSINFYYLIPDLLERIT